MTVLWTWWYIIQNRINHGFIILVCFLLCFRKHTLNCHRMKPALFSVLCEIKEKTGQWIHFVLEFWCWHPHCSIATVFSVHYKCWCCTNTENEINPGESEAYLCHLPSPPFCNPPWAPGKKKKSVCVYYIYRRWGWDGMVGVKLCDIIYCVTQCQPEWYQLSLVF